MKITHIVLYFGYVESAVYSPLIFAASNGYFESPRAALENLATSLFLKYVTDNELDEEGRSKACCKKNKNKKDRFCKDCGRSLSDEGYIDFDDYTRWVNQLCGHTCDGFGEELAGWDMNTTAKGLMTEATPDQVVEICSKSEKLMAYILTTDHIPAKFHDTIKEWQAHIPEYETLEKLMRTEL